MEETCKKRRVIFVDDDGKMSDRQDNFEQFGQIASYVGALRSRGIDVGPTREYSAEFAHLLNDGVFHSVDGAVEYFDRLVRDDDEWNAIDGMIIDAQMPPGTLLPTRLYMDKNAGQMMTGSTLIQYLSLKMWKSEGEEEEESRNRFGMTICLLTNHPDSMDKLKEAYKSLWKKRNDDPDFGYARFEDRENDPKDATLDETGIKIRYDKKITTEHNKDELLGQFVDGFEKRMLELDNVRKDIDVKVPKFPYHP